MSLFNWFRRRKLEGTLDRELNYHLDRRVNDLQQRGFSPEEARRQATLELGGVTQVREEVRDVWLSRWLRDFLYDLRFSLRSYRKTPSFTVTAVLSLMLGIGATTAIYSLVDQVLLHALPVREPGRLVRFDWEGDSAGHGFGSYNLMSYPICHDLDRQKQFFDGVFCRALLPATVSVGNDPQPAVVEVVSPNYFSVLGVGPALGQVITADDDHKPGANPVVVLSYDYWKNKLGGVPDVVGRQVIVDHHSMTVIGVAPASFHGIDVGEVPALWLPASMTGQLIPGFDSLLDRRTRWMQVLGRLNPGITVHRAQAGLQPWFKAMLRDDMTRPGFPVITAERRRDYLASYITVTPAPQGHSPLRRRMAQPLWVLLAVTAVLLGLACLNVSGLFLARGSAREREIGTRLALGASRGRLGRQLLTDSLLIALVGGVLGAALAPLAVHTLVALLPSHENNAATALHAGVDLRLLLFAFFISIAAGVLSGMVPAWQAGKRSLSSSLRERAGTGSAGVRLRKIIVTAQIALTLILVVSAALFTRTLQALVDKGPGFSTTSLVSFGIDTQQNGYPEDHGYRLLRRMESAIAESPVAHSTAILRWALLTGGSWNNPVTIQADQRIVTADVNMNSITPGFIRTMGIHLISGRNFDEHDLLASSGNKAIVNQAFVKRYLAGKNPLGLLVAGGDGPDVKPNTEIVGIVSDFSYRGIRENSEQIFFPLQHDAAGTFYVRVNGSGPASFPALTNIVHSIDPTLPLMDLRTVSDQVDRSLTPERMMATLSLGFGVLALLLSLVGLYGVMSFVVTQRTREIGIRMALGARRWSAIWIVLRDVSLMLALGVAIGLPVVWSLGRLVQAQLYDVKPFDPVALVAAVFLLSLASLAAAFVPAHRASVVNPLDALRVD